MTEGLPNAMVEAMSTGCVPIVTNVGNIPTVIKNGENGILVNVDRTDEIKHNLDDLWENNNKFWNLSKCLRNCK